MSIEEIAESLQTKDYNKVRGVEQYRKIKLMRNKALQGSFMFGKKRNETDAVATIGGVEYSMWAMNIGANTLWYYLSKATKRHIIITDKQGAQQSQIKALEQEVDRTIKQVILLSGESIREILQIAKSIATKDDVVMFISEDEDKKREYREEVLRL